MKDTFYFSHDYNTRSDENIKLLIRKWGMEGYGIFWALIEDLYSNANALRFDCEGIAYDLRKDESIVRSVISDFNLFVIKEGFFGSLSIERRLNERDAKSKKAKGSAMLRWAQCGKNANASKTDANALDTELNRNAIKESKGKESIESKGKESKGNALTFENFLIDNEISNSETIEFLNSESWFESKSMQLYSTTDILTEKAKDFLIDVRDRDMLEGKELNDLRAHFVSWFKKKREFEKPANKSDYLMPQYEKA